MRQFLIRFNSKSEIVNCKFQINFKFCSNIAQMLLKLLILHLSTMSALIIPDYSSRGKGDEKVIKVIFLCNQEMVILSTTI